MKSQTRSDGQQLLRDHKANNMRVIRGIVSKGFDVTWNALNDNCAFYSPRSALLAKSIMLNVKAKVTRSIVQKMLLYDFEKPQQEQTHGKD